MPFLKKKKTSIYYLCFYTSRMDFCGCENIVVPKKHTKYQNCIYGNTQEYYAKDYTRLYGKL